MIAADLRDQEMVFVLDRTLPGSLTAANSKRTADVGGLNWLVSRADGEIANSYSVVSISAERGIVDVLRDELRWR